MHSKRHGFSLVELSIVLVILGLLVGGILAGQSLIRAAELRSVSSEFQRYQTAANAFRDKYFAIPGDFAKATDFWNTAATCPGNSASPSTGAATCNGDGNGSISPSAATANESFRFWHHLSNAGLVEGQYSGTAGDTTATSVTAINANSPRSKTGGLWFTYDWQTSPSGNVKFEGFYGNSLVVGAATTGEPSGALFKPEELWNIDTKLDDGKPGQGRVVSRTWATCTNAASSADLTTTYKLDTTSLACVAMFRNAY